MLLLRPYFGFSMGPLNRSSCRILRVGRCFHAGVSHPRSSVFGVEQSHSGPQGTDAYYITRSQSEKDDGHSRVSAWHDINAFALNDECPLIVNFVNEIPRFSRAKMEMLKDEPWNPIAQDTNKDGSLRFFNYGDHGIPFNYGFIPQTWENPMIKDEITGLLGDNDPLDCVLVGDKGRIPVRIGEVLRVNIVGALALIDQGENDWKLLVMECGDDHSPPVDLKELDRIRDWFENYKTVDGKKKNEFALDGKLITCRQDLEAIIVSNHRLWKERQSKV